MANGDVVGSDSNGWVSASNIGREVQTFGDPFSEVYPWPRKAKLVEFLDYYNGEPNAPYRCFQFQFWCVNYGILQPCHAIRLIGVAPDDPLWHRAEDRLGTVSHPQESKTEGEDHG